MRTLPGAFAIIALLAMTLSPQAQASVPRDLRAELPLGDANRDGMPDILSFEDQGASQRLAVLRDGSDGTVLYEAELPTAPLSDEEVAVSPVPGLSPHREDRRDVVIDVDSDGIDDVVSMSIRTSEIRPPHVSPDQPDVARVHWTSAVGFVDGRSGSVRAWSSEHAWNRLEQDLTNDGPLGLAMVATKRGASILRADRHDDWPGGLLEFRWVNSDGTVEAGATPIPGPDPFVSTPGDLDGDGWPDIVIQTGADATTLLTAVSRRGYLIWKRPVTLPKETELEAVRLTRGPGLDLWAPGTAAFDGATGRELWRGPHLLIDDIDRNGTTDRLFATRDFDGLRLVARSGGGDRVVLSRTLRAAAGEPLTNGLGINDPVDRTLRAGDGFEKPAALAQAGVGDLDGDGTTDIQVTLQGDSTREYLFVRGNDLSVLRREDGSAVSWYPMAGDADGDQRDDLLRVGVFDQRVRRDVFRLAEAVPIMRVPTIEDSMGVPVVVRKGSPVSARFLLSGSGFDSRVVAVSNGRDRVLWNVSFSAP